MDDSLSLEHEGLLQTITEKDLKNTDVYLFRVSTGELIAERTGATLSTSDHSYQGTGVSDGTFHYTLHIRGKQQGKHKRTGFSSSRTDAEYQQVSRDEAFAAWQAESGVSPALHERESDHLRPGEPVKIIAINRATGYMGSVTTVLDGQDDEGEEETLRSAMAVISKMVKEIQMGPPNLKIWAERTYDIESGLTATNSPITQTIGNEGAALNSDDTVVLHTQWLDRDGSPLPEALADYGFTGRVARVVGDNQVSTLSGIDATFSIAPGTHLEFIQISGLSNSNDHLYVQVSGEPYSRAPSFATDALTPEEPTDKFATSGNIHSGRLRYRPDHYVPFLTKVWDEASSSALELAFNQVKLTNPDSPLSKPDAVYKWLYRPDFQYSVYDFKVAELNRVENGEPQNILQTDTPTITSSDDLLQLIYSLVGSAYDTLDGFSFSDGKDQQLIFALGETEIRATVGSNQQVNFEDLSHLGALDSEDFLSLRLYSNNDARNVLWQYAFVTVDIQVDYNRDGKIATSVASAKKQDSTSAKRPFRFWLNDSYDVVVHKDSVRENLTECLTEWLQPDSQECEQDQIFLNASTQGTLVTNSDQAHRNKIESLRDLQDFAPMVITLGEDTYNAIKRGTYILSMRAVGVGINVFVGQYETNNTRKYLIDHESAVNQVKVNAAGDAGEQYLFYLRKSNPGYDQSQIITTDSSNGSLFNRMFDEGTYTAKLIFEGVDRSEPVCTLDNAGECYVEVLVTAPGRSEPLEAARVYLDIQPVKVFYDHFTAGTWVECRNKDQEGNCTDADAQLYNPAKDVHAGQAENPNNFVFDIQKSFPPDGTVVTWPAEESGMWRKGNWGEQYPYRPLYVSENGVSKAPAETDYIMFVHGWRMPYAEREVFAETTLKRLYWQGYQGRFGVFTWPTGWFQKSAWLTGVTSLPEVLMDLSNYSRSEKIARDTSPVLAAKLTELKGTYKSLHLLAHSMGNVVVSEALRGSPDILLDTYVATQAATSAGAYAPAAAEEMKTNVLGQRDHTPVDPNAEAVTWWGSLTSWVAETTCTAGALSSEGAWRCNNVDSEHWADFDNWYDMPPDLYRYQQLLSSNRIPDQNYAFNHYYRGISARITDQRIINYYNEFDAALDGWNLQQITKPDSTWIHHTSVVNEEDCDSDATTLADGVICEVQDLFASDRHPPEVGYDLTWDSDRNAILAHILPSRTFALGATSNLAGSDEISNELNLNAEYGFTRSNYDHSAQWLSDYPARNGYWQALMATFGLQRQTQ